MCTKAAVDVNVFQDGTVGNFAAGMEHNFAEATRMFRCLQTKQRITEAAVGMALDVHAAVWSTLGEVYNLVNQQGELPVGLPEQG